MGSNENAAGQSSIEFESRENCLWNRPLVSMQSWVSYNIMKIVSFVMKYVWDLVYALLYLFVNYFGKTDAGLRKLTI